MTKTIKILTIIFLTISLAMMSSFTYADFKPKDYKPNDIGDQPELVDATSKILKYIRYIGIVLSVIILTVIGFRYILSSAEEKASYKENILLYVVGCILLMVSTTIPSLIYQVANG